LKLNDVDENGIHVDHFLMMITSNCISMNEF